ncbi:hypothetical protein K493DRAFT_51360 [Basidiobolus meristosporus CBS 931.73]|uniref:Uncharacterized protein n=1 Tax=Basidiobolus meristosporus CBS 931.73 TaxID=1314790 RepID=A0A1Y1Y045_9FUNG|nr:hypothetical protein K493DRAFT_51360 [Basidiobolus meristosporus CBS 931.73]|eukprot:ORX91377.1 hypothetical protein K493DRAFT_51360 [Basidiobolus meristosporus CBS 931.73]
MRLPLSLLLTLLSLHRSIDSAPVNLPGHQLDKFHEIPLFDYDFTFEVPAVTTPLEHDVDTEAFKARRIRLLESIIHGDSDEEPEDPSQRYPEIRSKRPTGRNPLDQLNENNKRYGEPGPSTGPEKRQRR